MVNAHETVVSADLTTLMMLAGPDIFSWAPPGTGPGYAPGPRPFRAGLAGSPGARLHAARAQTHDLRRSNERGRSGPAAGRARIGIVTGAGGARSLILLLAWLQYERHVESLHVLRRHCIEAVSPCASPSRPAHVLSKVVVFQVLRRQTLASRAAAPQPRWRDASEAT